MDTCTASAHGVFHCHRPTLKLLPTRFHKSSSSSSSSSSPCCIRSSDLSFGLQSIKTPLVIISYRRKSLVLGGRLGFKSIQSCFSSTIDFQAVAAVDKEEEEATTTTSCTPLAAAPLPSPWFMVPPGLNIDFTTEEVVETDQVGHDNDDEYYHLLNVSYITKKVLKIKKNLWLPWQREILSPHDAICFGSSHGWLAFIHPRNCSLYLYNPFIDSSLPYIPLPPIETLPCIISSIRRPCHNSTDNKDDDDDDNKSSASDDDNSSNDENDDDDNKSSASSSSSSSNDENDDDDNNKSFSSSSSSSIVTEFMIWKQMSAISSEELSNKFFKELVMSSAPYSFPQYYYSNSNSSQYCCCCTVMVIQGHDKHNLAFCRIGDTSWTALDTPRREPDLERYEDIVYFSKDQRFYALSSNENIDAWDLRNPASPKSSLIISSLPPRLPPQVTLNQHQRSLRSFTTSRYLVESSGELLMVVRYEAPRNDKTSAFDVYKLDFDYKEWVYVPSLGDRALFVGGITHSVSLCANHFPGLKKNSIYFTPQSKEFSSCSCNDLGVFNLEDNTIIIYRCEKIQPFPIWVIPPQLQTKFN